MDINAQLGRNVLVQNEDPTSFFLHHKLSGPFSAHVHSNTQGKRTSVNLAAFDLTSAATWKQKS
eukprot:9425129-Ditylum_brightwellii.AAC.1